MTLDFSISKKELRSVVLEYRRRLALETYEEKNHALMERLKHFVSHSGRQAIHTFLPIKRNNEPDITTLLPWLWQKGIRVVVSKTNFDTREMAHYQMELDTALQYTNFGIPEPEEAKPAEIEGVDSILVPLVTADRQGNRVGYGGGFYDQLMQKTKATKVGLCLSPLLDKIQQSDPWDVPLDIIITPYQLWQKQHSKETK